MPGCAPPWDRTASNTFARTTGGRSCWESTSGCSRRSETRADPLLLLFEHAGRCCRADGGSRRNPILGRLRLAAVAVRRSLSPRPDLVALDHLVQRGRLDVQELGGALLDATGGFERRFDQPLLEVGDDLLERNALRRHDELRHLKIWRLAHVIRYQFDTDAVAGTEHHGALDDVLELAHVAWPVVFRQQIQRLRRQLERRLAVLLAVFFQEVMDEQRDIVLAVAQRRQ